MTYTHFWVDLQNYLISPVQLAYRDVVTPRSHTGLNTTCPISDADVMTAYFKLSWVLAARLTSVCLFIYFLIKLYDFFFVPFNRVRLLEEIGYHDDKTIAHRRKDLANLIRKRRKVGEKLPPVYPNGWFQLMDSNQLAVNQVKEVCALGEHFAVYRTKSKKVRVLDAYCPHMGSNLAVGGLVKDECLQCPFHGWVFDGKSGECVKIPYSDKIPKNAKTKSWNCREMNGGIYVWYHAEGVEPSWELPLIDEIATNKFQYKGRVEHHINTHIQDIPENGSDLAHLSFLHIPNVLSGTDLSNTHDSIWNCIVHIFKVNAVGADESSPHISKFLLQHYLLLLSRWKFFNLDFDVYQIGPGTVHLHFRSCLGEGVFVQTLTPVEPLHLVLVHRLYATWRMPNFIGKIILAFEAIQVDRDVMVWNNKTFMSRPLLVKQDHLIGKYRRWFAQFYSENSPTLESLQSNNDALDW